MDEAQSPTRFATTNREHSDDSAHLDGAADPARCAELRIDYAMFDTSQPLDHALYRFLGSRQKMMKVR